MLFNLAITLTAFTTLFVIFDFLDRIDNIIVENPNLYTVISYFALKIPSTVVLVIPLATMTSTLLTVGLLCKNSEFTAMRACGTSILSLTKPILYTGIVLSLVTGLINETIVPYATKRVKEIYNIKIKKKDQRGSYSQSNFWWRDDNKYFSFDNFDSSTNTITGFTQLKIREDDFLVTERTEAKKVNFIDQYVGWSMKDIENYKFSTENKKTDSTEINSTDSTLKTSVRILPLPINKTPEDFYDVETEPDAMSYKSLRRFIKQRITHGISVSTYLPDLYAKISFPLISFLITIVVIPFSVISSRGGSIAKSIILSISVSFAYYVVHSLSVSMGQAELITPFISAWLANLIIGTIGAILLLGAESPS